MIKVKNERIGEAVYSYGKREGLTRDEVSSRIGMCTPSLNLRINGKRTWRVNELIKISDLTGVGFNEFFEEVEE